MSFKKNRHPPEPLFKQHKIPNFKKQKILSSVYLCGELQIKRRRVLLLNNFNQKRGYVVTKISNFTYSVGDQTNRKEALYVKGQIFEICSKKSIRIFKTAYLKQLEDM